MTECIYCKGFGYTRSHIAKDNNHLPMVIRCVNPDCPYISNYYKYIKLKYTKEPYSPPEAPKDTSKHKDNKMNINIPNNLLSSPDRLANYVANKVRDHKNKYNPDNLPMSEEYPNLPMVLIEDYNKNKDKYSSLALNTPFGIYHTTTLEDANRVMGTLKDYWESTEELNKSNDIDNVVQFPLGKSLGLE